MVKSCLKWSAEQFCSPQEKILDFMVRDLKKFGKHCFRLRQTEICSEYMENKKIGSKSQFYQTFYLRKPIIFPFFAIKLGHFMLNSLFFICYKHSSLPAKIGKQSYTKFGRINSWSQFVQIKMKSVLISLGLCRGDIVYLYFVSNNHILHC